MSKDLETDIDFLLSKTESDIEIEIMLSKIADIETFLEKIADTETFLEKIAELECRLEKIAAGLDKEQSS